MKDKLKGIFSTVAKNILSNTAQSLGGKKAKGAESLKGTLDFFGVDYAKLSMKAMFKIMSMPKLISFFSKANKTLTKERVDLIMQIAIDALKDPNPQKRLLGICLLGLGNKRYPIDGVLKQYAIERMLEAKKIETDLVVKDCLVVMLSHLGVEDDSLSESVDRLKNNKDVSDIADGIDPKS